MGGGDGTGGLLDLPPPKSHPKKDVRLEGNFRGVRRCNIKGAIGVMGNIEEIFRIYHLKSCKTRG